MDPDTQHTLRIVSAGDFGFDYIQLGDEPVKIGNEGQVPVFTDLVVTPPDKTEYQIGEELNLTGLKVEAVYSDESTIDVTTRAAVTGFESETAGEKTITVSYRGLEKTFTVTVSEPQEPEEPQLAELRVTGPDKTEYQVGEELDLTGLKVEAVYSNNEVKDVTGEAKVTGFESETTGEKIITVSYGGLEEMFTVTVSEGQNPENPGDLEEPGDPENPGGPETPEDPEKPGDPDINEPEFPDLSGGNSGQTEPSGNTENGSDSQPADGDEQNPPAVQTGDTSDPVFYAGLMMMACGVIVALKKTRISK